LAADQGNENDELDNLDEDLAVEDELRVSPDDLTDGENADSGVDSTSLSEGPGGVTENSEGRPVIRDRRKIDPTTGRARPQPSSENHPLSETERAAMAEEVVAAAEVITARAQLKERTEDLQRVQADYANYRKRVERDRGLATENGKADVLTALISVLDDIDAARTAGELTGPFKSVADKLEATLARFGLERYGAVGEEFDPTIHEALTHQTSASVDGPTVTLVIQPGYRMGERILRAARVGVTDAEA
jgi:molecular chaperone GrpE